MNLRQFLKPDWKKVIIALIFTILFNPSEHQLYQSLYYSYEFILIRALLWGYFLKVFDFLLFYIISSAIVRFYDNRMKGRPGIPLSRKDWYANISLILATVNLIITIFIIPGYSDQLYDLRRTESNFAFMLMWTALVSIPFFLVSIIFSILGLKSSRRKIAMAGLITSIIGVLGGLFFIVAFFTFPR